MFPQFEFPRCPPVFIIFFSVLKPKGDLSVTIFLWKPISSRIRKGLCNQMLASKNWMVNFSSVLDYPAMSTRSADLVKHSYTNWKKSCVHCIFRHTLSKACIVLLLTFSYKWEIIANQGVYKENSLFTNSLSYWSLKQIIINIKRLKIFYIST